MAKARKAVKRAKASATKKSASKGANAANKASSKAVSSKASSSKASSLRASSSKAALHVIIYTTQTCPFCKLAKELLASKQVSFTERDVLQDKSFAKEMISKSHQMGVPVLDINGHVIVGYDKEAILKAITR